MLLVAHRAPAAAAACRRLAAAGATVFEVDVQQHEDGIRVSHYVPMPGIGWLQRDNWRLRTRRCAGRDASLADAVAAIPADCAVLLDLKETTPVRRAGLIAAISAVPPARFVISSPVAADLDRLRATGFRTWRTVRTRRELADVLAGRALPDEAVTVRHTLLTAPVVEQLQARVPRVIAWTVNDSARARRLVALGVDGLTTDQVASLRAAVG